ncbi:hypothetical protein AMK86_01620 [Escherichia coli]|nr:hypothetical protein AMK86_01620 [Escherichia coli]
MNERLKTHSKTQKKSADLVSNKLRIGVFQLYQMKCKSVSKKSPRYMGCLFPAWFAWFAWIFGALCWMTTFTRVWSGYLTLKSHQRQ